MRRRIAVLALILLSAGCGGGAATWSRPGADQAAVSREYQECRELAGLTVETQANIDQDISATRQSDIQRSGVVRSDAQLMRDRTKDRAGSLIDNCMRAKGLVPKP